ncbi:MAG: DUF2628 domain-containing protein [Treponema sp.]
MKEFRIFESPQGDIKAMKSGFSLLAFLFSSFWALYHGLFSILFIELVVGIVSGVVSSLVGMSSLNIIPAVIIKIIYYKDGNSWLENNLIKKGYIFKGSLNASDSTEAISLYEQSKKGEEARRRKIEQEREIEQIVRIEGISETEKTSEE